LNILKSFFFAARLIATGMQNSYVHTQIHTIILFDSPNFRSRIQSGAREKTEFRMPSVSVTRVRATLRSLRDEEGRIILKRIL